MTREEFRTLLGQEPVLLDGAMGTSLMKAGMSVVDCPEIWAIEHPEVVVNLQKAYVEAGAQIVYAPTFGANRMKLKEYGLDDQIEVLNGALVALTKSAVGEKALVAGDMTMTGKLPYPVGDIPFEEFVTVYKEQARLLAEAGVDLFVIETMMSLQECRAAVIAMREVCDLPIMATLTFNDEGRTLYGTTPEVGVVVLQSLGVDAIGVNCSTGPEGMVPIIQKMAEYATVPLIAKPNAGLPEILDKETVYRMTPEEFATSGKKLVEAGAALIGGCCGTTPAHIKALAEAVESMTVQKPLEKKRRILTSERKLVEIELDGNFLVVGERINPTGKKKLQEELREGKLDMVRRFAIEQETCGASLLDINMGMSGIDELAMTKEVIYEVSSTVDCPLVIDTSHIDVMEEALRIYPGRALINSISLESAKADAMLALAKKYGAMFILLPLSDKGLPENMAEKLDVLEQLYDKAMSYGLDHEDMIVDGLVTTIGANPAAGVECFETFTYCKEQRQLPTICGLSNISFGVPERGLVNTTFLTMAMAKGLTMAIANPCQEQLMNSMFTADMLLHHPNADVRFVEKMNRMDEPEQDNQNSIYTDVVKGSGSIILEGIKTALSNGEKPEDIINKYLIPAINEVGQLFNDNRYFLPQLIRSANTMKTAIDFLEPSLKGKETQEQLPTIIIATVKGDIHDIGKNLVTLMLKNYGYTVIDMGKDVETEAIIDKAMEVNAGFICLSALMTTTMMRMGEVVEMAKEKGCKAKILVGGACITEEFAKEIGADGYAKDAAECVKVVERLRNFSKTKDIR